MGYIKSAALSPYQEISGTSTWDKDESDDLQIETTAITALAGHFAEVDGSTTNELQTLSVSNYSIYISDGNGIKLRAHYVGKLMGAGGVDGIVFWVDHTGEHGLICSLVNIEESSGDFLMKWDDGTSSVETSAKSYWE